MRIVVGFDEAVLGGSSLRRIRSSDPGPTKRRDKRLTKRVLKGRKDKKLNLQSLGGGGDGERDWRW